MLDLTSTGTTMGRKDTLRPLASTNGSGASLVNCLGPVTPTSVECNFAFNYSIGGVAQQGVVSGGAYETWTPPGLSSRICDNPHHPAPRP